MKMSKIKLWWSKKVAILLFLIGCKYKTSTNVADYINYGYGKLDHNGFWQFPLWMDK